MLRIVAGSRLSFPRLEEVTNLVSTPVRREPGWTRAQVHTLTNKAWDEVGVKWSVIRLCRPSHVVTLECLWVA